MAGRSIGEMGLIEVQEAFAAQVLADLQDMGVSPDDYGKANVNAKVYLNSPLYKLHQISCKI